MYDRLFPYLTDFNQNSSTIEASALVSTDGLVMASTLPSNINEDHIGAMSAAMLSVGNLGIEQYVGGALEQMLIKGAQGYILMTLIGKELILTVMAKPNAKLEQLLADKKQYIEKLVRLI